MRALGLAVFVLCLAGTASSLHINKDELGEMLHAFAGGQGLPQRSGEWMKGVVRRVFETSARHVNNTPLFAPALAYCLKENITNVNGGCDVVNVLVDTATSVFANDEMTALMRKIMYEANFQLSSPDHGLPPPPSHPHGGTRPVAWGDYGKLPGIVRDEFTAVLLWMFLHCYRAGEEMGLDLGMGRASHSSYPMQEEIKVVDGNRVARYVIWTPEDLLPKWHVMATLFPSFERWYSVYTKEAANLHELSGGVRKICTDFLPFVFTHFDIRKTAAEWPQQGMSDVYGVFRLSEHEEAQLDQFMKGDVDQAAILKNELYLKKFRLQSDLEDIKNYWGCDNPPMDCSVAQERLVYVFHPTDKQHDIPKEDAAMCWKIMKAAVENYDVEGHGADEITITDKPDMKGFAKYSTLVMELLQHTLVHKTLFPFFNYVMAFYALSIAIQYIMLATRGGRSFSDGGASPLCDMSAFEDSDWLCHVDTGGTKSFCVRNCGEQGTMSDHRVRHMVSTCTEGGMRPSIESLVAGNQCGAAEGVYGTLDMAYIT